MANVKISDLTAASSVATGDLFEIEQSGPASKKATIEQIRTKVLTPKGAQVKLSADLTAVNATSDYAIGWDAEEYDTDSVHDNATNNSRLTVPSGVAWVELGFILYLTLLTSQPFSMRIYKNGAAFRGGGLQITNSGSTWNEAAGTIVTPPLAVSAGDYFTATMIINSDTSVTIKSDHSCFWMSILA